ncbi:MAG: metallophosphoesterase family protein [Acidocella sp.]|nr:metallophosphoesterase family protein [Acidocella sp.]
MFVRTGEILIFGGCYSNIQATQALLRAAAQRRIRPETMFSTGDIIAYGADAATTLRLIRDTGVAGIAGNCERALAAKDADCGCGFAAGSACHTLAAAWFAHADAQMDQADRDYMASLPDHILLDLDGMRIMLVHGNVERINAFVFPSVATLELSRQLDIAGTDAVIAGHSGLPFTRHIGARIWHNAGSIGMPANDGTPRGWYSLVSVQNGALRVESHALDYDHKAASSAMRQAGLPAGYAVALGSGVWPSLEILPAAERLRTGIALEHDIVAAPAPAVALSVLEMLWINTGTLCNIACEGCFMESSPTNDSLAYFTAPALADYLARAPATLRALGFTGGEPFMNPDIMAMIEAVLITGREVLVLSNAMRPMQRHAEALSRLAARYRGRIGIRVSLDHYRAAQHDALRGPGSFKASLKGLHSLSAMSLRLTIAARTPWGESEAMMRAGFAALFASQAIGIDAQAPDTLLLFPEMDEAAPTPPVTAASLAALPPDRAPMCVSARMLVMRRGMPTPDITPCTLLPGRQLPAMDTEVTLDHAHCARFCVYGGASCAGAPG